MESVDAVVDSLIDDVSEEKPEPRSWKGSTLDDVKKFYDDNYKGFLRGQVAKLDGSFYKFVRKMKWLDEVFPESLKANNRDWSWLDTPEKAKEFYEENFKGKSRTEVRDLDRGFHAILLKNNWLDEVLPKSLQVNNRDWSWMDTPEKAKEFYEENYSPMTRGKVMKKDRGFYHKIFRLGWLDKVFPPSSQAHYRDWSDSDLDDLVDYYADNYEGLTRHEVEKKDSGFYAAVRDKGLLDKVFPKSLKANNRDWSALDVDTAREIYESNFKDMPRHAVFKVDPGFYHAVRKKGLLDEVFPESAHVDRRNWSGFDAEKSKEFYEENFPDMTRSQVKEIDQGFYSFVCRNGWLDEVFPPSKIRDWSGFDVEKARDYYEEHYFGLLRNEVEDVDSGFYGFVCKNNWQYQVFLPSQRHRKKRSRKPYPSPAIFILHIPNDSVLKYDEAA